MALPKKKISVSQKKIRFNSKKLNKKLYTYCDKCYHFILLHRDCLCSFNNKEMSTNIVKKHNL